VLITNARIVNEGLITEGDILIKAGRIEKIGKALSAPAGSVVHDAAGKLLLPGMIDDQVHFREPGLMHKGNFATESAAAVAGGITSFMEMPNTAPPTTDFDALEDKFTRAAGRAHGNYAFYFGATNDNAELCARLEPGVTCGIKIFMGSSTGNMLVNNPATLEKIFAGAQVPVVTHCEDDPTIKANEAAARERWGNAVPISEHPNIRSAEACEMSTRLATGLARQHGTQLHVLHLTTARELKYFSAGPVSGKKITVEACVHHLYFDESDYAALGTHLKCNPAVKTAADRIALVRAVSEDVIDVIATDHAPHTRKEKAAESYFSAPSGLPLVQDAVLALFNLVKKGEMSLETLVRKTSHAPADRFGVIDRGYIREGYWADLMLVDPNGTTERTAANTLYHCGWSAFEGRSFAASIDATWVNGELAWDGRNVLPARGQRLQFRPVG